MAESRRSFAASADHLDPHTGTARSLGPLLALCRTVCRRRRARSPQEDRQGQSAWVERADERLEGVDVRSIAAAAPAASAGVGDVACASARRPWIPIADSVERPSHQRASRPRGLKDSGIALIPGVAERGVAVADMCRARIDSDAVGEGTGGRDHEVVPGHVQLLGGPRHEGQQCLEGRLSRSKVLKGRSSHSVPGQAGIERRGVIEQGGYRRCWPQITDRRECSLGAAHDQEIVVHEDRPRFTARRRS